MHDFDDETIRCLLAGTDPEINVGLILLNQQLRQPLCSWLGQHFPGMSPDDLADAWGETLLGVLRAARHRRFQPDQPLLPWLCRIVQARGIDHVRRVTAREKALATLPFLVPARRWQTTSDPDTLALAEVWVVILSTIARLPPKQQLVLRTFVECFPQTVSLTILQEQVSQRTGFPQSRTAVKRALRKGQIKLRILLREKGFELEN